MDYHNCHNHHCCGGRRGRRARRDRPGAVYLLVSFVVRQGVKAYKKKKQPKAVAATAGSGAAASASGRRESTEKSNYCTRDGNDRDDAPPPYL